MANFEHNKAREKAPQSVQDRIEEYDKLSKEQKEKIPLLYWILGTGTPAYKMSKKDSHYIEESDVPNQDCANCKYLYWNVSRERYICSQIRGEVVEEAWCHLWAPFESE